MNQEKAAHRTCSRSGCTQEALATLTYDYQGATAVLGPLSVYAQPHCYDLCATHAHRFRAPRGWHIISMLDSEHMAEALQEATEPDDLLRIANAVKENTAQKRAAQQQAEQQSLNSETAAPQRETKKRLSSDAQPAKPQEKTGWLRLITSGE